MDNLLLVVDNLWISLDCDTLIHYLTIPTCIVYYLCKNHANYLIINKKLGTKIAILININNQNKFNNYLQIYRMK